MLSKHFMVDVRLRILALEHCTEDIFAATALKIGSPRSGPVEVSCAFVLRQSCVEFLGRKLLEELITKESLLI